MNANETSKESIYGMNLHENIVIRSIRSCATICLEVDGAKGRHKGEDRTRVLNL